MRACANSTFSNRLFGSSKQDLVTVTNVTQWWQCVSSFPRPFACLFLHAQAFKNNLYNVMTFCAAAVASEPPPTTHTPADVLVRMRVSRASRSARSRGAGRGGLSPPHGIHTQVKTTSNGANNLFLGPLPWVIAAPARDSHRNRIEFIPTASSRPTHSPTQGSFRTYSYPVRYPVRYPGDTV